jgi:hypothetical protein
MNIKLIIRNLAIMLCFGALGLVSFSEGVRTAQILGLFAAGWVCGASFSNIIHSIISAKKV